MLATEVHQKFYLNVTKLRAAAVTAPRLAGTSGRLGSGSRRSPRGWAVSGGQVRCSGGGRACAG